MPLPNHRLKVVLVEPEIPQNTGNIARLCAVTGAELHLVRPLGFFLTEKNFKRAGMDYLKDVPIVVHDDLPALWKVIGDGRFWLTSAFATKAYWDVEYMAGDWIFFGKESAGLPREMLEQHAERCVTIPMVDGARGLNLATSAGIVVYEAVRQIGL
jgi:tRNA (cytidine/uridine-2'-O-)-methyltransferase